MRNAIVKLFEESGMSIKEFASKADLKYSTAHDIVTGKANIENIGAGAFVRIARVFNTTADALLGSAELSLTPDEEELINVYRQMEPWERELVLDHAKMVFMHAVRSER